MRRTMEKYAATCRIVLIAESLSKIIEPVRSRCLTIRVPAPTEEQIAAAVDKAARSEVVTISPTLLSNIAKFSDRNMRRALLMAEASRVQANSSSLGDDAPIQLPDWERYIAELAREVLATQTPQALLAARARLYELLSNCIPPEVIFKSLVKELCKKMEDSLKHRVVQYAAAYEARLAGQGQKAIYHLEAFLAKVMAMYKKELMALFA